MIRLVNKPDIEAPSIDYPFGSIQDDSAGIDGTPLNRLVHSDQHQFFEKLIEDGEVTANNLPDNSLNGYQLNEALDNVIAFRDIGLVQSINQNTDPTQVWQFYYKNIINTTGNSNLPATVSSTWTWGDGGVIYNYKVYNSSNGTTTLNVGEFLVYYIIDNKTIGIRKNTEGAYIQAVDLLRYINLEKYGSSGALNFALIKRGNVWNLRVNGSTTGSNIVLLKNYNGNTYNSDYNPPLITHFGYYDFADTVEFSRGSLQKNANNDLILNLGVNLGTRVDFTVNWVQ